MSITLLRNLLWSHHEMPELEAGEPIILEGRTILIAGLRIRGGVRLILTDRRLIWYEPSVPRPLSPLSGQIKLSDVASVDQGTILDMLAQGFRVRLRQGKDKLFPLRGSERNDWIAAIRRFTAEIKERP
jgi:hypothetical protein